MLFLHFFAEFLVATAWQTVFKCISSSANDYGIFTDGRQKTNWSVRQIFFFSTSNRARQPMSYVDMTAQSSNDVILLCCKKSKAHHLCKWFLITHSRALSETNYGSGWYPSYIVLKWWRSNRRNRLCTSGGYEVSTTQRRDTPLTNCDP